MRVLITGGNGFIGKELQSHLKKMNHEVHAPTRQDLDLTSEQAVTELVTSFKPNHIYHLAGISRVNDSFGMPEYFASNTLTTFALIKGLENYSQNVKFFFASSMHVYGNQTVEVNETTPPAPHSYYAFTKYLSEKALQKAAIERPDSQFVIARLYSCFGPEQPEGFVAADLLKKLLNLKDPEGVLKTGPLNTFRRFVDVRDVARVIPQLLTHSHVSNCEIFNLVSPYEFQISELLDILIKLTKKSPKVESTVDQNNAFKGLKASGEKFFSLIGPSEFRPVESTLKDMVEFSLNGRNTHAS